MASAAELRVKVVPDVSDDFRALIREVAGVEGDVVEKVNAGASLTYSLYYASSDLIKTLPGPVVDALVRAQHAYGVGIHTRRPTAAEPAVEVED